MTDPPLPLPAESRLRALLKAGFDEDLARRAVRRGLLTEARLEEARRDGRPLSQVVAERGWIAPADWAALKADWHREVFERASRGAPPPLPPEAAPFTGDPSRVLAEFLLVSRLGRGGAGEVWKAWDRLLGRWVALKRPSPPPDSPEEWARFHREIAAVARLQQPNILPVHRVSGPDEPPFFVMPFIEGETLEGVRLPFRDAVEIMRAVALAVDYAHRQGVLHRDLKPGNLIRDRQGTVWILDFGLAFLLEASERITTTGVPTGTPEYMSPEQARGGPAARTAATDVYGLGATLYALVAGRPPFTGTSVLEILRNVESLEPSPLRRLDPSLPADLDTVVARAMNKDPGGRYPDAAALAEDLRRLLAGEPVLARPETAVRRLWRKALLHHPAAAAAVAMAGLFLAAGTAGGLLLRQRHRDQMLAALEEARRRDETGRATELRALALLESVRPTLEKAEADLYTRDSDGTLLRRDLSRALASIEEAARLAPRLPLAQHRRGEVLELRGDYRGAEEAWRRTVALDSSFGPAHYRLGRVLILRAYLDSLELWHAPRSGPGGGEPTALEAAREIEAARATGSGFDHDLQREVAAAMLAWVRRDPDAVRRTCREALGRLGNRRGAEELYWILGLAARPPEDPLPPLDAAIALRPKFPLALYARAAARLARRDFDGAVADYDEAIRILPDFPEARLYRATAFYQKGDAAAAEAAFTEIIQKGLLLPAAYNGRGWTRIELAGDLDGGIADLTEAIRRRPEGYGLPYAERARAHFRKGAFAEAAADCTKAIPLLPDWDDLRRIRARCRAALGDIEGAAEDLRAVGEEKGGEVWRQVHEAWRRSRRE